MVSNSILKPYIHKLIGILGYFNCSKQEFSSSKKQTLTTEQNRWLRRMEKRRRGRQKWQVNNIPLLLSPKKNMNRAMGNKK